MIILIYLVQRQSCSYWLIQHQNAVLLPQYSGLQKLYDRYKDDGFVVLGVPSNDFNQELGNNADVKDFCEIRYGVNFP